MIRQFELVERVRKYDPQADENLLNRAYVFSMKAHGTQMRASGDPYFSHPLEVAGILTEMRLDSHTIVTALLHDTVEDTVATIEEIEELFGKDIAKLVDGVTKLSRIEIQTDSLHQAENFQKFLLALSNDIRVLLVKLADRLHNMRTLHHIKDADKRRRIAMETMDIYAPLAERIGMRGVKEELEDIAFQEINAEAYDSVTQRLGFLRKKGIRASKSIARQIRSTLSKAGLKTQVSGREKTPYSIWNKMERYHVAFEQLADVMAFRVIVGDVAACYQALGIIHTKWPMVPGRFKDYISMRKRNGYRSIHTTVIGPRQLRIEIQIRTGEMHDVAEHGVAAHWRYKQGAQEVDGSQYRWIQELLEILEQASSPEEFLEHTKLAMFHDQVFCFTPKGELVSLPRGSTTIDFAYAVHTGVGDTCVGAKVNGRLVPLRHQLSNGDQVEILRSKAQTPSPRWESFVVTGKARAAIRRFVRKQQRAEYAELGQIILESAFRQQDRDFTEKALKEILPKFKLQELGELYVSVGQGLYSEREVLRAVFPAIEFKPPAQGAGVPVRDWEPGGPVPDVAIPIRGLTPGVAVHLAECCHPLPGDRIVVIRVSVRGIIVHTIDCENLGGETEDQDGWLDLSWRGQPEEPDSFIGRLELVVVNEPGTLAQITSGVAKQGANIANLRMTARDPQFFTILVDVEVTNVKHLNSIAAALRSMGVVSSADRVREGEPLQAFVSRKPEAAQKSVKSKAKKGKATKAASRKKTGKKSTKAPPKPAKVSARAGKPGKKAAAS